MKNKQQLCNKKRKGEKPEAAEIRTDTAQKFEISSVTNSTN